MAAYRSWQASRSWFGGQSWFGGSMGPFTSESGDPRLNQMLRNQAQQESLGISGLVENAFAGGNLTAALNAAKNAPNTYGADPILTASWAQHGYDLTKILGPQRSNIDDKITAVDNLTQLQNAQTTDKNTQVANLQAEMDWLQTLPETISRDQKIVSLQQSIDQLKNATDANTAATQATLNPLYSQGHGALAIGYYKAASGLDLVAQGPTSEDQIPFHAMINGVERVLIQTPAQQAANNNRPAASVAPVTIVQNFDMRGVSTNNARRSQRQFAQGFGQIAAASS